MEEFDRIKIGTQINTGTNRRKMMIVFALIGVLVLASAGALVYFYKTSSSAEEGSLVESKVRRDGKPKIGRMSFGSKRINNKNPENETISHGSISFETGKPDHLVLDENDDSPDEYATSDSVPSSSLGSNNIDRGASTKTAECNYFFEHVGLNFDSVRTLFRLNDDGSFSERFTVDIEGNNAQISQSSEQICGAAVGEDNFQVYTVDLKTKKIQNVLKVPFKKDQVGDPKFHFSPDCESFVYYFEKNCEENGFKEKSKVILRDLKTDVENVIDWVTEKYEEIYVRNGGRVVRKSKKREQDTQVEVEVSLFSKENYYKEQKLFVFQSFSFILKNAFQVNHDASRILYVEFRQNLTENNRKDRYSIIFDVSSKTATDFGTVNLMPFLSMNGGKIAYYELTLNPDKTKVKVVDVETRNIEKEFELKDRNLLYAWSNNGKYLFFDNYELKKLSLSDGVFEPVMDTDGKILDVYNQ